jgi:ferredoxin-NADP reductase
MARGNFKVEVTSIRQLTDRIREYRLTSVDRRPLPEYGPGAHVAVHTLSVERGLIVRHYSLLGGDDQGDDPRHTYRIAVQREAHARGSAHIHATFELGTRLEIGPPVNNFPLGRRDKNLLLLAGGIGITPIFSMARSLARRDCSFKVVYAGRNRAAMAYRHELERMAGSRLRIHCSDSAGALDLEVLLREQPADTVVYVCGPSSMVGAVQATAAKMGWEPDRVRSELFGAAFSAASHAFDVHLVRSGRTVHVSADASILDALTSAGVPVLSDCRRGECGLCPLPVVSSDGDLQHNDRYLSDEEKAAGEQICICVSRTCGRELVLDA